MRPTRRSVLIGAALSAVSAVVPAYEANSASAPQGSFRLRAAAGRIALLGDGGPVTEVWCYDGTVPGPELRVRQGARLRVEVENGLSEDTTVHWHGVRVPNAMDGVPGLTQEPIAPGGTFTYEFDAPDAGTYWYHPHARSFEQVGRGLYGALIIEENEPPPVDRDLIWVLGDWRLLDDARISEDFGNMHDASHAGRVGNTVTLNGRVTKEVPVRAGERLRLRLINTANARIFALSFEGHRPRIIALDGQPVEPHEPDHGRIVLGPAQRADLIIDMMGKPGETFAVADSFYKSLEFELLRLVYDGGAPVRPHPPDTAIRLQPNRLPEPQPNGAERHELVFGGGMMGRITGATMNGRQVSMRDMMKHGMVWTINGTVVGEHDHAPLFALPKGSTCILTFRNETVWHHPMHLHGHVFRVLARNGVPTQYQEWRDTALVAPEEQVEIGFVADNPGHWMLHCHVLEHQATGMTAVIRVA